MLVWNVWLGPRSLHFFKTSSGLEPLTWDAVGLGRCSEFPSLPVNSPPAWGISNPKICWWCFSDALTFIRAPIMDTQNSFSHRSSGSLLASTQRSSKTLRQNKKHNTSHNLFFYYEAIGLHPSPKKGFENIKETGYFIVSRWAMRKAKVVVAFVGFLQEADSGGQTIPTLTLFSPSATLFNDDKSPHLGIA